MGEENKKVLGNAVGIKNEEEGSKSSWGGREREGRIGEVGSTG